MEVARRERVGNLAQGGHLGEGHGGTWRASRRPGLGRDWPAVGSILWDRLCLASLAPQGCPTRGSEPGDPVWPCLLGLQGCTVPSVNGRKLQPALPTWCLPCGVWNREIKPVWGAQLTPRTWLLRLRVCNPVGEGNRH